MNFADFIPYNMPELGPTVDEGCGKEQVSAFPLQVAGGSLSPARSFYTTGYTVLPCRNCS